MMIKDILSKSFLLIILSIISSCELKPSKKEELQRIEVWKVNENKVDGYRIPGIVTSKKGTVLAFAEERPSFHDAAPKSILLKRSTDNGLTWSDNIYIEKSNGDFWKQHQDKIDPRDVKEKMEVWTNMTPIVDYETGRIFIFYALSEGEIGGQNLQRYTRVFFKTSDNDGKTWSKRKEVTDVINANAYGKPNKDEHGKWKTDVNGFPCDYLGRSFHMPGPGHGLQLSNGRLLLQVWNRTALGSLGEGPIPVSQRKYGICTIYSDDHGASWKYGSAFGHDGLNMNESRMAERANGDIYLNARYVPNESDPKNNHRITAISHDKGESWQDIRIDKSFPHSNPCDAGLVAFEGKDETENILLYSKNESPEGRKNLVVRLSDDGGLTWPLSKVIEKGDVMYSDLAVLPDDSILLIYETGKNSPIYCVRFSLDWLRYSN